MTRKTLNLSEPLLSYIVQVGTRETKAQCALRELTADHPSANMQIAPEQGEFLRLLVKLLDAKKIMELGVFTGYSSLSMALSLPDEGQLIACDVNEEYTNTAQQFWADAGVADRIELILAPALETMQAQLDAGSAGTFDLIFADAIKEEYLDYYEMGLRLLRSGGMISLDNTLWDGSVIDPENQQADTVAIRKLNLFVQQDERVDMCLLPIGDGLTLARKR